MLVGAYVLREGMCLLLKEWTFLHIDLEEILRAIVSALVVVLGLNEVSKWMINILKFDLNFLVHRF